ncbi:LOW QUALITY PROTEIN: ferric-chelate reductase 1, partial [Odontesthes bonariensis]
MNNRGRVTIRAVYVTGRTHPELETEETLWGQASRLVDVIQCRFHRNSILSNRFDLNQSYYLFLAHGRSQQGSHPYIGFSVVALSVIQPIMAILRPSPLSPRRIIFSWMHFGAGTIGHILAEKSNVECSDEMLPELHLGSPHLDLFLTLISTPIPDRLCKFFDLFALS